MVIAPLAFGGSWGGTRIDRSDVVSGSGLLYDVSCLFLESSIVSELGGFSVASYVDQMRPFWLLFVGLAILLAFFGTKVVIWASKNLPTKSMKTKAMVNCSKRHCLRSSCFCGHLWSVDQ